MKTRTAIIFVLIVGLGLLLAEAQAQFGLWGSPFDPIRFAFANDPGRTHQSDPTNGGLVNAFFGPDSFPLSYAGFYLDPLSYAYPYVQYPPIMPVSPYPYAPNPYYMPTFGYYSPSPYVPNPYYTPAFGYYSPSSYVPNPYYIPSFGYYSPSSYYPNPSDPPSRNLDVPDPTGMVCTYELCSIYHPFFGELVPAKNN